eukprot:TRINITY_DN65599_c0_g1_i5.p3 TRINITY_DN65599_c0_g1~~TRINITY_DN65599_c0_g1_i5.p3  ORF type:complete len:212 (-),score=-16.09 TRINITY_DN65599_c0_g1_i5:604-1239(-)
MQFAEQPQIRNKLPDLVIFIVCLFPFLYGTNLPIFSYYVTTVFYLSIYPYIYIYFIQFKLVLNKEMFILQCQSVEAIFEILIVHLNARYIQKNRIQISLLATIIYVLWVLVLENQFSCYVQTKYGVSVQGCFVSFFYIVFYFYFYLHFFVLGKNTKALFFERYNLVSKFTFNELLRKYKYQCGSINTLLFLYFPYMRCLFRVRLRSILYIQ